jgi:hypothetical protein
MQLKAWEQPRSAYLFSEGLIDGNTANVWADEVWCPADEKTAAPPVHHRPRFPALALFRRRAPQRFNAFVIAGVRKPAQ